MKMQECISCFCMLPHWLRKKVPIIKPLVFTSVSKVNALLFPSSEGEVFFFHLLDRKNVLFEAGDSLYEIGFRGEYIKFSRCRRNILSDL